MWKTSLITFLLLMSMTTAWALPKSFEVWFLSIDKVATLEPLLNEKRVPSAMVAQALQCQPMGDYCFDPQVGLYKAGEQNSVQEQILYEELDETEKFKDPGTASSLDRQLVNCEGEQVFDIFCGAAVEKKGPKLKIEVWIDISGTMKQVDFLGHDQSCYRESFVRSLDVACPFNQKMKVQLFNESKKEAGQMSDVCLNYGLNEADRLINYIEKSEATHLIVITDIFEAHERFINFIETSGTGTIKGLKEPLYAKDMKNMVQDLSKKCQ